MKNIIVIGASGHAGVVVDCIEKEGKYTIVGYVDTFKPKGLRLNGYPILGDEHDLPQLIETYNIIGGIVAIGDNWTRKSMVDRINCLVRDFNFISAVHPSAILGKNVSIGVGTVILAGVIINSNCCIGDFCIVNTISSIDHDSKMKNFSSVGPRVSTGGNFLLEQFSAICIGAIVLENIRVMEHSVVGANSLVNKNVKNNTVVYGSPAKVIKHRNTGETYLKSKTTFIS